MSKRFCALAVLAAACAVGCGTPAKTSAPVVDVVFASQDAQFGADTAADTQGAADTHGGEDADTQDTADVKDSADEQDAADVKDAADAHDATDVKDAADVKDVADVQPDAADAGTDADAAAGLPLGDFASAWLDAWCGAMLACPTPTGSFSSVAACKAFYSSGIADEPTSPWVLALQAGAGLETYDGQAASDCIALIKTGCAGLQAIGTSAACKGTFHGLGATGSACTGHFDCKTDLCKLDYTKPACAGTCAVPGKAKAKCFDDYGCEAGLACIVGQCGPANGGKAGDTCGDTTCGAGLYCEQTGEGTSACTPLIGSGKPCMLPTSCQAGLHCAMDPMTFDATCEPAAAVGKPCKPDSGYESFQPGQGTACVTGAVCAFVTENQPICLAIAASGQPCEHPAQCAGVDLACIGWKPGVKGTCGPLPKAGQPCVPPTATSGKDVSCDGLLPCDPGTAVCTPLPTEGQSCTFQCAKGLTCHQKQCQQPGAVGQGCTAGQALACDAGLACNQGKCVSVACP
jgi:hypothetical protein